MTVITAMLSSPWFLGLWAAQALIAVALLVRDVRTVNAAMPGLMKWVWSFTVGYSGLLGLIVYWVSGRPRIADDADWRRGARSTAHCYSGCGAGEITGIVITVGILSLGTWPVALTTFALAYVFGYALTVAPLMQEGVGLPTALKDAFYSETASIAVMEIVAIGADLYLAGNAGMGDVRFWSSLVVSLSLGYLAAWPVNIALVKMGVKEGMGDPREYGRG
ncbi:copper oxidase [Marinicauda salina]|uniref:Copper oxidase n=1 Tax=Marinicauda salina TaxID=2135793 RepID=A0A2U2BVF8_9PROT|nr:DUF4396 domain-containing protein [Marinicauda salina]PWE17977.1 copper oxidase [Marinicauda salina]